MTLFYVVRHGQTEWNRDNNRYCGSSDIPLSDLGQEQAEQLAQFLQHTPIDLIYSSPLQRARATAQPTASVHSLPIHIDPRISEIHFGQWEGMRIEQIQELSPDLFENWVTNPTHTIAGASGETAAEVFERMNSFFNETSLKHPEKRVLVLSHSTAIRIYLAGMLAMPFSSYRQLVQSNAGVSVLESPAIGAPMRLLHFNCRFDTFRPATQSDAFMAGA
jgi:uncharacterized phosphatase